MNVVWNAIVKNEAARIERCVKSLLPYVDGAIVVDTGSSDNTSELIMEQFTAAGKPVELYSVPFVNFSQARNEALRFARASHLPWQRLLLCDADMELKVERSDWLNGVNGSAYDMRQTAGSVSYWNRRVVSRQARGDYVGVTHEYLDIAGAGRIDGAWFLDHADGANRPDKLERDIKLLQAALQVETSPGLLQRYNFYLAQSFFDLGRWREAAEYYKRRVALGGWDEERWNAQLHYAHCLDNMGDKPSAVWALLEAYEMRPQRAETLYDLAKLFRERGGSNYRSLLFSEPGMVASRPGDMLFVNDYVYRTGLNEEFSICAYYDPSRQRRGAVICNQLALDRNGTDASRQQARNNLFWYLRPLSAHIGSLILSRLDFKPPDDYVAMNPSVINHNGKPLVLVRTVNYKITPEGRYESRTGEVSADSTPIIRTRNFLVRNSFAGLVEHQAELQLPTNWPETQFELVRGFEDSRLFEWFGQLWTLSTVRELTNEGWCEQVLAPLIDTGDFAGYRSDWVRVQPEIGRFHEKNWMPWVFGDELRFMYRLGTVIDQVGKVIHKHDLKLAIDHCSGGSQVIQMATTDTYLVLVHESGTIPGTACRFYQHRFALLSPLGDVLALSPAFYFHDRQIEFAAGMALFGDQLVISFGVRDEEAWLARMRFDEVLRFVWHQEQPL